MRAWQSSVTHYTIMISFLANVLIDQIAVHVVEETINLCDLGRYGLIYLCPVVPTEILRLPAGSLL